VQTISPTLEVSKSVSQLLKEKPNFTIAFAKQKLFYLKDPAQLDSYLVGLPLAGVPEKLHCF
jgi:hypothetical protein